jgi:hypothetical protein
MPHFRLGENSMSRAKFARSSRRIILSVTVLAIAVIALMLGSQRNAVEAVSKGSGAELGGTSFPGTGTGAIPDGNVGTPPQFGDPLNVTFNVSGITEPMTDLSVDFTTTHTWAGDVDAVLIAPGGSPTLALVSRIGVTVAGSFGDSSNYDGTYNFTDAAAGTNLWTIATNPACGQDCILTAGSYRTTAVGQIGQTNPPPVTSLMTTFGGLTPAQINGTWTLRFRDGGNEDTGEVTAANLTITAISVPPASPNVDFDGDGTSDFSVARDNSGSLAKSGSSGSQFFKAGSIREKLKARKKMPPTPELGGPSPVGSSISWFSSSSSNGTPEIAGFGEAATDFLVPNDYDGDGQTDFAVWRPGTPTNAAFYVLNSANSTVSVTPFGQDGDDPAITGDYDGDGSADLATYRCPVGAAGQCFFFFRGSAGSGDITYVPWGFGEDGDFFVNPGDFDGDNRNDFCIQRSNPSAPASGQFVLLRSSDLGIEYINWGTASDLILPGDYDGDGRSDFTVRRDAGGNLHYYIMERDGGGTGANPIVFGVTGDVNVPGDYDGDGRTDIAIWRENADPNQNFFWVLRSSNGAINTFEWGQENDVAVANWLVH